MVELKSGLLLAVTVIILVLKFTIGLNTPIRQVSNLKTMTGRFLFSLFILIAISPVIAFLSKHLWNPGKGATIAMVLLAASPGAPLSALLVVRAGGDFMYAVLLQIVVVLLSVFTLPFILFLFHQGFDLTVSIHWLILAKQIFLIVFLPLVTGLIIHHTFPDITDKVGPTLGKLAKAIFSVLLILFLFAYKDSLFLISLKDLLVYAFFIVMTLLVSHFLGGRDLIEKKTVALMSISRHIGIVIYIALFFFEMDVIVAYIIPFFLLNLILEVIYITWVNRLIAKKSG